MPALMGMVLAQQALQALKLCPSCHPRPVPALPRDSVYKLLERLQKTDSSTDLTCDEASWLIQYVWRQRDAFDQSLRYGTERGKRWSLVRWDRSLPASRDNLLLLCEPTATHHIEATTATGSLPPDLKTSELAPNYARVGEQLRSITRQPAPTTHTSLEQPVLKDAPATVAANWRAVGYDPEHEQVLLREQLSRNASFFGESQSLLQEALVVVVGLGRTGSHAAHMIARAGCKHLRLVDRDVITSSCLRAHATATPDQLGMPRAQALQQALQLIVPSSSIDCVIGPFDPEQALSVHQQTNQPPTLVLDCCDEFESKVQVLNACATAQIKAVTCLGVDLCTDPTMLAISKLDQLFDEPAGRKLCHRLEPGHQLNVTAIYSTESCWRNTHTAESSGNPLVAACLGMAAASWILCTLAEQPFSAQAKTPSMSVWKKLASRLRTRDKSAGFVTPQGSARMELLDYGCLADSVWGNRCAMTNLSAASTKLVFTRWNRAGGSEWGNLVLLSEEMADYHDAATAATGGLPVGLLQGDNQQLAQIQTRLTALQKHMQNCGTVPTLRSSIEPTAAEESPGCDIPEPKRLCQSGVELQASFGTGLSGLIGNTPMIELRSLSQATGCTVLAKAEFTNPGGCQKDRVAQRMVEEAEAAGLLTKGGTIVEGTSGSTGISLSMIGRSKDYNVLIVMPDDQAKEKVQMLEHLGSKVELVKPSSIVSSHHYVNVARTRASEIPGAVFCNQFENLANYRACLLYTSDAADEEDSVDLGGRRIIKKKKKKQK
eukprot:TRINITY_DN4934_c0_g1_i5.p1 TRINITY_DN4934_c0_g1~~TRINITY_DN4934_c0_g1_i5.p1  ORF type:complete len:774 (-),score=160.23 TRINITY_DN4934_c0_g1_i5:79-2400(-)